MGFFYSYYMKIDALYQLYTQTYLVDTDTRNIRQNSIFFALKGDNFNGNAFAEEALSLGAKYAIIDESQYQTKDNILLVDNVLETLQQLANYHRKQLTIPFIGLTGSNGKTTTKELIHTVLAKKYKVLATKGNLNNHIGVPLTLLSITPDHEIAIIEMGANHQKEIAFLSAICEPDYGYITNFGKAHLEGFGGVKGVIKGKSELYTYLKENRKIAIVNPNDPIQIEKTKTIKSIFLNDKETAFIEVNPFIKLQYKNNTIQSQLIGAYNYTNILAAITFGEIFQVATNDIILAIEAYVSENNRSQVIEKGDKKILLDAYNANPSSMKVALENFAQLDAKNKLVILGDMFELGKESHQEHQAIIDLVHQLNFELSFFIGENFYNTSTDFLKFHTFDVFLDYVQQHPISADAILIKGSRGMRLERVLDLL